jgi:hypothetical protein
MQNMFPASHYLLYWKIEAYRKARAEALMKLNLN